MIPELIPGQVVFVTGPVSSGKTFLLQKWSEREQRVLLFDTAGDHIDNLLFEHIYNNPRALVNRLRGDNSTSRSDQSPERGTSGENQTHGSSYRIAYHPQNVEEGFDWCMSAVWQLDEPRYFIIEELHELMSPWAQHPKMKVLNKYARKRAALGVIGSSQRLADVHKDFTSAARMSVLFFTQETKDIEAISDRYGSDVENAVRGLRPLLYRDAEEKVIQTPQAVIHRRGEGFETVDIG